MDFERIIKKVKGHFDSFELFYLKEKTKNMKVVTLILTTLNSRKKKALH